MEVAGLTASIITLIGAATLAGSTVSRIWGLRDSVPAYVLTALNEIEDFKATLQLIRFALEGLPEAPPDLIDDEIARFLKRADKSLADFNDYLRNKVLWNIDGDIDSVKLRRRAKLKEVLGEAEPGMRSLHQDLTSIKLSLNTALAAMHLRNSGRRATTNLSEAPLHQRIPTSGSTNEQILTTIATPGEMLIARSSQPSSQQTLLLSNLTSSSGTVLSTSGCKRGCPCRCHKAYEKQVPRWLSELSGIAYFRSLGIPLFNHISCDLKTCSNKAQRNGSMCLQYSFPRWVLPYMIQATAYWQSGGAFGGRWSLRFPKNWQDGELGVELCKYIRDKSPKDVARFMAENGIRAFDQISLEMDCFSLIEFASELQREDITIMLMESGASLSCPDVYGVPIVESLWFSRSRMWPTLRQHALYVEAGDYISRSLRHTILMEGTLDELTTYLQHEPQAVLVRDTFGPRCTLLHWAILAALPVSKVRAIIDAGADINARCSRGLSALMCAVHVHDSVETCELLLASGADVNEVDPSGRSVLYQAILRIPWTGAEELIDFLIRAGADVHYRDFSGKSLLQLAVETCPVNVARVLLDFGAGAEINRRDHTGWYPFTIAIFWNHHQALELLIQRGARLDAIFHGDEDYISAVLTSVAMFGDIRTMNILTRACISGVRVDQLGLRSYWMCFNARKDQKVYSAREPLEAVKGAFQRLLDSVTALDLQKIRPECRTYMPGSFLSTEPDDPFGLEVPPWSDESGFLGDTQLEKSGGANSVLHSTRVDNGTDTDWAKVALIEETGDDWSSPWYPKNGQYKIIT